MLFRLIRKEFITTRWVHLVALAMALGLTAVAYLEQSNAVFMMVFTYLIYTHLLFNQCRFAAANRADNGLLNSLPLSRSQVVAGKYGFVLCCSLGYALLLSLLMGLLSLLGVALQIPPFSLFLLLSMMGVLYNALLMPLSYIDARYGTWASMLIYLAILILPQQLSRGQGKAGAVLSDWLARLAASLGSAGIITLLVLALLSLLALSYDISRRVYRKAEF